MRATSVRPQRSAVPVSAPSPVQAYLEALLHEKTAVQAQALCVIEPIADALRDPPPRPRKKVRRARGGAQPSAAPVHERLEKLIDEALFPPLEAMALVRSTALINHSCAPNCELRFGDVPPSEALHGERANGGRLSPSGHGGAAWGGWRQPYLAVLREIAAEGELTVAYIDPTVGLRERREALLSGHGFRCRCERCCMQAEHHRILRQLRAPSPRVASSVADETGADGPLCSQLDALGQRALDLGFFDDAVAIHQRLLGLPPMRALAPTKARPQLTPEGGVRRANAMLRLGGALQRLHRFDEAQRIWTVGAREHPANRSMRREVERLQAYAAAVPHAPSLTKRASERAKADAAEAVAFPLSYGRRAFLTASPLLDDATCSQLVQLAEHHAKASGGWSTARHTTVPTTDMEVRAEPQLLEIFNEACAGRLFPVVAALFAEEGVRAEALRVSDAFVIRYDARAQSSLPIHTDDSHFSLTIALNAEHEYTGGGTCFEDLATAVRPALGHVVAFPGSLRHGGEPISEGVRYAIAAFLWVSDGWQPPSRWGG